MKSVVQLYAQRAKWYDKLISLIGYAASRKAILKKIPLEVPQRILDLGAGTGLATEALRERFPSADIIASDFSQEMLQVYHKKFSDIKTIVDDFNNPKKLNEIGKFDLIVSTGAVTEYGDYAKVIPLIHKLLRNKGVFIAIGVKRNFFGKLLLKGWYTTQNGKEELVKSCKMFSKVEIIPIPWYLPQSKLATYVLKAVK